MKQCSDRSSTPATLGVSNMLGENTCSISFCQIYFFFSNVGVFLLVAGGIFAGFFLLAIEIAFKRRKDKRDKEVEVSRTAVVHWKKKIEVGVYQHTLSLRR